MTPSSRRRTPLTALAALLVASAGCGSFRPATAVSDRPGAAAPEPPAAAAPATPTPATAAPDPAADTAPLSRMDLTAPLAPFAPPTVPLGPPPPAPRLTLVRPEDVGMDAAVLARLDSVILRAIRDGATPGAALAVGRRGGLVRLRGYGRVDWDRRAAAVDDSTIYDLASLTKVVATTTAAMLLVEERLLHLDASVARWIPEWTDEPRRFVTPRHLLTHTGGLPAGASLLGRPGGREGALRAVLDAPLSHWPGTRMVYSDYDMILLGTLLERIAGETLDYFLARRVFGPLDMRDTGFNPWDWPGALTPVRDVGRPTERPPVLARVAPTELVRSGPRRGHLHGHVHDPSAYALGGVAGHAGLFSSARDLAVFAQFLLNGGAYGERHLLRPATVRLFAMRQSTLSARALGWETPSGNSSAGAYFPATAFGHTGYTGTSLWIDPEQDLFVVLLTNRVNPSATNQKHVPLRRAVHDAVQLAITDARITPRAGD